MDINKIQAVVETLKASPEVTKNEAFASFMTMGDRIEAGDHDAIEAMAQMVGVACSCDDPEMTRRFVKYVSVNGPI